MRPFAQISLHCQGTVYTTSIQALFSQLVLAHLNITHVKSHSVFVWAGGYVSCRILIFSAQECVHSQVLKYGNNVKLSLRVTKRPRAPSHDYRITTRKFCKSLEKTNMICIVQITSALATSFEFVLATTVLVFFASTYLDLYCIALWQSSGSKDWDSEFGFHLHLHAKYLEISPMPLIWDERYVMAQSSAQEKPRLMHKIRLTQYNLCAAVVTMVLWIVRLCIRGRTLDIYGSIVSNVLYDIILIAFWSYSVATQPPGHFLDSEHLYPQRRYFDHECNEAWPRNPGTCETSKVSFGLAVFSVFVPSLLT